MTGEIRVLLVDDQELVRSGLRRILRRRDGFVITGECGDGDEVPAAVAAAEIDVVVMDLRMKRVDGIEAIRRLRAAGARPPVLALTTFDDDELLAGALRAGAAGYILKESPAEDLIRAVRAVSVGDAWLDAAVTARVLTSYRRAADERRTPPSELLTTRELDVLRAAGRGMGDAEIAEALAVSPSTVTGHVRSVLTKLGLRDRAAAIVYAFDHGIVTPGSSVDRPTRLRFDVLGPLQAWRGRQQLDLGPVRQQALLAALLLYPDTAVSRTELLHRVWGLEPPGTGERVLPVYVHRLRKCLRAPGDEAQVISWTRHGYRFVGDIEIDTAQLTDLVAEMDTANDPAAALDSCTRALGLFHGEPLASLPGPFAESERRRLTERRTALAQRKAELLLQLGRHAEAVGELFALLAADPVGEPVAVLLMHALRTTGRRADALAVYGSVRDRLRQKLDVEPGEDLRRAYQALLRDEPHQVTGQVGFR